MSILITSQILISQMKRSSGMSVQTDLDQYLRDLEQYFEPEYEQANIKGSAIDVVYKKEVSGLLLSKTVYVCISIKSRLLESDLMDTLTQIQADVKSKPSSFGHQPQFVVVGITDELVGETESFVKDQKRAAEWDKYLQEFIVVVPESNEVVTKRGRRVPQSEDREIRDQVLVKPFN